MLEFGDLFQNPTIQIMVCTSVNIIVFKTVRDDKLYEVFYSYWLKY